MTAIALLFFSSFSNAFAALHEVKIHKDIQWATPKNFELTADIYVPQSQVDKMPVLIIYHGGGWLLNTKEIMNDLALYISTHSDFVVVNTNYRTLGSLNNTTHINEIIDDAIGAVLWVKDNIEQYRGDKSKIAVTGDSAGGHLAAMITLGSRNLSSKGFGQGKLGFHPTYLPKGKTAEQVAREDGGSVQATILSYAGFDVHEGAKNGFEQSSNPFWGWANVNARGLFGANINVVDHPKYYKAASPNQYIVNSQSYQLPPQFVLVGSEDKLTTPESAKAYVNQLKQAGQPYQLQIIEGKGHGFLDSGCPTYTNGCFSEVAVPTVKQMISFLNSVFY